MNCDFECVLCVALPKIIISDSFNSLGEWADAARAGFKMRSDNGNQQSPLGCTGTYLLEQLK